MTRANPSGEASALSLNEVADHWDANAASWAAAVRAGGDTYREFYNNPAFLAFVGDLGGKAVLDAGCGEGYNSRILARRGAHITGADLSPKMIGLARAEELREPLGIRYHVASFTDLAFLRPAIFDAAVSFMALMDSPDFPAAMRSLRRVLKPGAPLCFSVIHPCFMTKGFAWIEDNSGRDVALRQARYFDQTPWVERWYFKREQPPAASEPPLFAVPRFDYILSDYINGIAAAGLILEEIHEARPTEAACRDHQWLQRWRDHAPLFLYFRARNP